VLHVICLVGLPVLTYALSVLKLKRDPGLHLICFPWVMAPIVGAGMHPVAATAEAPQNFFAKAANMTDRSSYRAHSV
jgi:hypothetical protein